ncbi:MAG: 4-hydroxy-tetrahydrodipicolinate synthase [Oscillospiraceae bacterium]|nr:4-hydroxy-tetrahydrodipicolinate synthase [Oscillospiraceae bacterium]
MKTPVFTGSAVALVTPFRKDNITMVDFERLAQLVEYHNDAGTDAIVVCGTTGEASTQKIPEHLECISYCVKQAKGRIKIIGGTGSNDTEHALMMSKHSNDAGADGLLLVTPYYNKCTQRGLIKHYLTIADAVDIPIILYNVPSRTGVGFTEATYKELSKHPLINGVKEASGNFTLAARTLAMCGDDLNMWSGNDDQTVPLMALGAKGVISVTANIMPEMVRQMTHLCLEGKYDEAAKIQLKYQALNDALFVEVNPIPVKTAMNLLGMNVGELRMPLCDMAPENLEKLKAALVGAGLELKA